MSEIAAEPSDGVPEIRRLTFDLDVEVCVVGGGLAGLCVAREAAKLGASVALLEGHRIGWGASAWHLGTVGAGFDVAADTIIARIGRRPAAELWRMSQTGAEIVRVLASEMSDVAMRDGALTVSSNARGDRALEAILALGSDFGVTQESWTTDRVRDVLDTKRYFGALYDRRAFQIDSRAYLRGLVDAARQAGVRIFEETPVTAIDVSGTRKRITTPAARLRAAHVVLAGNVHLGAALPRLTKTLLPVWRYGAVTAPLGERLAAAILFDGSVADSDGIDHFRVLGGGRLMWSSPQTTWQGHPQHYARAIQRRMQRIFPGLSPVKIAETFGGAVGQTVHGMPQIGQLRPGLWVASGFGRQGLNTTAMAGRIIARGILYNDDRWRLFGPFDLIWAGGRIGRVAGYAIEQGARGRAGVFAAMARRREASAVQARLRKARVAAVQPTIKARQLASLHSPLPPSPFLELQQADDVRSQESDRKIDTPS